MNTTVQTSPSQDLEGLTEPQPDWFRRAYNEPRSQGQVEVEGARINYFRWGNPQDPGIVLTHGFMAHARCWAFIAPLLAKENYCLVAFDLSGMGDSGHRPQYSVELRAAECAAVADAAGLTAGGRKASLVCHSYGGRVGLTAVQHQPRRWERLIICDMTMLAPGEKLELSEHRQRMAERGVKPHNVYADMEKVRQRFRLAPDQPCANDYLMEYMARHSVKAVPGGFQWKFDPAILAPESFHGHDDNWWESVAPTFAALKLPRAIVYGEHSSMMSPAAAAYLRQATQDHGSAVPMVQIPDAYHHIMLDQPLALVAALSSLLQML